MATSFRNIMKLTTLYRNTVIFSTTTRQYHKINVISRCGNNHMLSKGLDNINWRRHRETHYAIFRNMCSAESRSVDIIGTKHMHMFDTHAMVNSLIQGGYTTTQAEAIVGGLVQITQAKLEHMNKNMVSKVQQEIMVQQLMAHISSVKKDMIILEKSEFSALKHEYEKQNIEIDQMRHHFKDELMKQRSDVTLDLNLEKSRAKEAHHLNERELSRLINRFDIERKENDKQISMLDNKIEKEIANLLATYERYRNDVMKYAGGTVFTCLTVGLGFLRLWS